MRISKRLNLLVLLCIILTCGQGLVLMNQRSMMLQSFEQTNHLTEVQLRLDLLRSNLWLLQQFRDQKAIDETASALDNLHHYIDTAEGWNLNEQGAKLLANLRRHRENISILLQLSRTNLTNPQLEPQSQGNAVLTARYNSVVQSMSEDVLRLQTLTINNTRDLQLNHLYFNGMLLSVIAILVTLFSLQTLARFKGHLSTLKQGIKDLARGDLLSQVDMPKGEEFGEVAEEFNTMKQQLREATEKRDQLQQEVAAQTQQLQQQQEKLRHLAEHDDLTGVLNRGAASLQIQLAIERCKRQQQQAALLFIDLDKFKPINDRYGHSAGDIVLQEIAQRLQHTLRASDMIARIGGDEFIVWLEPIQDLSQVSHVVEKIRSTGAQIPMQEHLLNVGVSVGISIYPEDGSDINALLRHADIAMYQAKKNRATEHRLVTESPDAQRKVD